MLPFGNAARATITVCSGTSGRPTGRIDMSYCLHGRTTEEATSGTIIADPPSPRSDLHSRVIGLFKTELNNPQRPWKTLSQVELATAEWVDWYCHRRLHGEIGHVPPVEYETNYYTELTKPQVTTAI
ncbi:integrase core domain-containing protein [Streptomyces sp. NPDC049910]|uniref:integrase core domain-containing protein n=1 Tax=Streptomyces sp. NPDC049910 TaxID=3155278 RepID=UPI00341EE8EA